MIYFAARGYSRLIPSGFFILKAINVAGKIYLDASSILRFFDS